MKTPLRVLIVEDSHDDTLLLVRELRRGGFAPKFKRVDTAADIKSSLGQEKWDLVLADYTMPRFSGTDALKLFKTTKADIPFIFVSGTIREETAVAAMKAGAHDYVTKGDLSRLVPAIRRELKEAEARRGQKRTQQELEARYRELLILKDVSQTILSSDDIRVVLDRILGQAMALGRFDMGTILVTDLSGKNLETAAIRGHLKPDNLRQRFREIDSGEHRFRTLKLKRPRIIENVPASTGSNRLKQEGVYSAVSAPVRAGEVVFGAIQLGCRAPRKFARNEIQLIEALGHQIGIAVQKDRLFAQARKQTAELEKANAELNLQARRQTALAEIGRAALSSTDLYGFIDQVATIVAQTVAADYSEVAEILPSGNGARICAGVGWKPGVIGSATVAMEAQSHIGYSLLRNESVCLSRLRSEQRFAVPGYLLDHVIGSGLVVVVPGPETEFGTLAVYRSVDRGFSVDDRHFLEAVANLISVAVRRKRAEDSIKARYQELMAFKEVAQTILSSMDLRSVLEQILKQSLMIGSFDLGAILLLDPTGTRFETHAAEGYRDPLSLEAALRRSTGSTQAFQALLFKETQIMESLSDTAASDAIQRESVRSALSIPVRAGTKVLGVIHLGSRSQRRFKPDEIHALETLGDQMGIAVQKRRLYEETSRNLERIRALYEIDKAITSTLDLGAILQVLIDKTASFLPDFAAVTVRLLNPKTAKLDKVACRNIADAEWKSAGEDAGGSFAQRAVESKGAWIAADLNAAPATGEVRLFQEKGFASYLGVPLIAKDETLGILECYTRDEHSFSSEEIEFLSTLAGQAAIAIEKARLYGDLQQQTADLERANRVKSEFLSVMSHELRTPLSVILGYTALIQDKIFGEINPRQEKALETVAYQSGNLLMLINTVIEATKIETGDVFVEKSPVDLRSLLEELKSTYREPAGGNLALVWDLSSDILALETDANRLKHILQHLLNNAIKFTDQGAVTVSTRYLRAEQSIEFAVTDTGIGIQPDHIPRIFDRFYQVDSSETRPHGGVGLGLYIAQQFTELLGGTISVESETGKGSKFTVKIPVRS
ncbi:MAG: GAF domain-containing protein [Candidatus Binatia bacterium]